MPQRAPEQQDAVSTQCFVPSISAINEISLLSDSSFHKFHEKSYVSSTFPQSDSSYQTFHDAAGVQQHVEARLEAGAARG